MVLKEERGSGTGGPVKIDAQAQIGDYRAVSTMVISEGETAKKEDVGKKEENSLQKPRKPQLKTFGTGLAIIH